MWKMWEKGNRCCEILFGVGKIIFFSGTSKNTDNGNDAGDKVCY